MKVRKNCRHGFVLHLLAQLQKLDALLMAKPFRKRSEV